MEDYIQDKKAIYQYQVDDDFCVFNGDQPETLRLADEAPAGRDFFNINDVPPDWRINSPGITICKTLPRR